MQSFATYDKIKLLSDKGCFYSEIIFVLLLKWNLYFYLCNNGEIRYMTVIFNAIIWKVLDLICIYWSFPGNSSKERISEYLEILYRQKYTQKYFIPCMEHLKNISLEKYQSSKQKLKMCSQFPSLGSGMDKQVDHWMALLWFPINSR